MTEKRLYSEACGKHNLLKVNNADYSRRKETPVLLPFEFINSNDDSKKYGKVYCAGHKVIEIASLVKTGHFCAHNKVRY